MCAKYVRLQRSGIDKIKYHTQNFFRVPFCFLLSRSFFSFSFSQGNNSKFLIHCVLLLPLVCVWVCVIGPCFFVQYLMYFHLAGENRTGFLTLIAF